MSKRAVKLRDPESVGTRMETSSPKLYWTQSSESALLKKKPQSSAAARPAKSAY